LHHERQDLTVSTFNQYKSQNFSSALDAADWWMINWLRPNKKDIILSGLGTRKHLNFLNRFPKKIMEIMNTKKISLGMADLKSLSIREKLRIAENLAKEFKLDRTSYLRYDNPNSLHWWEKGRAMDFSDKHEWRPSSGTPPPKSANMMAFAQKMVREYGSNLSQLIYTPLGFGIANGKRVPLSYWGEVPHGNDQDTNSQHYDHVHVAFEEGGKVHGPTRAILGEKGPEFVLDADTTAAFEDKVPGFLSALNKAKYSDVVKTLENYTTYETMNNSSVTMMQRIIIEKPIPIPISQSIPSSSSSIDSDMSVLESLTIG